MYKLKLFIPQDLLNERDIINSLSLYLESPYQLDVVKRKPNNNCKSTTVSIPKDIFFSLKSLFKDSKIPLERVIERIITPKVDEKYYQQLFLKKGEGWIREVKTPVGYIDGLHLKDKRIIEMKFSKGWKSALGQILSYGFFYKDFKKEIWLLGKLSKLETNYVEEISYTFDVKVKWIVV